MRIAVTGASGFVGSNLIRKLILAGYNPTVITHQNKNIQSIDKVTVVKASVDNQESLVEAFNEIDIIFHLVGIIKESKTKTFEKTVARGTKNVVDAAVKAGVKKIIYVSALGTAEKAQSKYHRSKYKAEQSILNSQLEYTIFRPSVIYGEGDGFISMLTSIIKKAPFFPVFGDGLYKLQPIHIDDLCEVLVRSINTEEAQNKIIDLGGPDQLEYVEIIEIIMNSLNKKRFIIHIPLQLVKIVVKFVELFKIPLPITSDQLLMLKAGNTGDIEQMKRIFDISPLSLKKWLEKNEVVNG